MRFLKICLVILFFGIVFSACERQGNVVTTVDGTPSNADTVLTHKYGNNQISDSAKEAREKNLAPEFKR